MQVYSIYQEQFLLINCLGGEGVTLQLRSVQGCQVKIAVIDSRVYNVQIRHSAKDAPFGGSENLKAI